jgi:SAM-dependent methyltransferase
MLEASRQFPPGYDADAPLIDTVRIETCPLCGGAERMRYAQGFDYESQTCRNHWTFWQCAACEGVWLDPRPAAKELPVIYPPTYYAYAMSETLSPLLLKGKDILDRMKLRGIRNRLGRNPRTYLDVGCGDGRYMRQFADSGMPRENIYGIDLPSTALPKLRDAGFNVWEGRVEDCTMIAPGSLDLITMFHVIEHVEDPIAVMRKFAEWLAPGGILAMETPNTSSIDRRLFSSGWWGGFHIPRHWILFNAKSMVRAIEKVGLEQTGLVYQTGHSFWLYSFHHAIRYNSALPLPALARWFNPLKSRLFLIAATGFDILRRALGAKTSAMLVVARKR